MTGTAEGVREGVLQAKGWRSVDLVEKRREKVERRMEKRWWWWWWCWWFKQQRRSWASTCVRTGASGDDARLHEVAGDT